MWCWQAPIKYAVEMECTRIQCAVSEMDGYESLLFLILYFPPRTVFWDSGCSCTHFCIKVQAKSRSFGHTPIESSEDDSKIRTVDFYLPSTKKIAQPFYMHWKIEILHKIGEKITDHGKALSLFSVRRIFNNCSSIFSRKNALRMALETQSKFIAPPKKVRGEKKRFLFPAMAGLHLFKAFSLLHSMTFSLSVTRELGLQ